jgi:Xaa-Pro aminopeptidase
MDFPFIPREEFSLRLERLRALMERKGLAGILLTTGANLAYFTAYPSPAKSVPRPFFAVLPLRADPVFITQFGHLEEARRYAWIADVRYYTQLSHAPVELLRESLGDCAALGGKVGMELGFEQTLDISYAEFTRLRDGLQGTQIEDASEMLWELRKIKSENEISCHRKACEITSHAYSATFPELHEGMTEMEIYRIMRRNLLDRGGEQVFLSITSGQGNYDFVTKTPEERVVKRGDIIWLDAGCSVRGYWSDFSRTAVVGRPSPQQVHAQNIIHDLTMRAVALVKPGTPASAIAKFCFSELGKLDFAITSSITHRAERVGHGIGLNMTEPPHVAPYDHTPLQPRMVITIEPGVATEYGTFQAEEDLVVTTDGCEVLSQAERTLAVIPQAG